MKIFTVLLALLSFSSYSSPNQEEIALTTSADGIHFTNERFKFSITKPRSWFAINTIELITQQQGENKTKTGDDENFNAITQEALKTVLPLFGFHEFAPGTPTNTNSSLMGLAENISELTGIKNGCDYLHHAKQFTQSQLNIDYGNNCHIQVINGVEMSYVKSQKTVDSNIVKQKLMACVSGEHVIIIAYNLLNKKDTLEMENVIKTLKVQCKT